MKNKIKLGSCKKKAYRCNDVNGYSNYMQIAIDVAERQLIKQPHIGHEHEIPIGCVIVDNKTGKILAKSCNKTIKSNNSLQHAEIICINRALKKLSTNRLTNCSMYITLEPCIMCAGAIIQARLDKVYIGAMDPVMGACGSKLNLLNDYNLNYKVDFESGLLENEAKELMQSFFKKLRNKN